MNEISSALLPPDFSRIEACAELLIRSLSAGPYTLALAESCTGGLVAQALTNVPGASRVLWGSFVCYTLAAKVSMLCLDEQRLLRYGLVSRETVIDMAVGALEKSGAFMSAAVTGLAGPGGDNISRGVSPGNVWVAVALREGGVATVREFNFSGSRHEIRLQAATAVFEGIFEVRNLMNNNLDMGMDKALV